MSIKIIKDKNTIGFLLSGYLTGNDFVHVIHDIELLCHKQDSVNVLFETENLKTHDFKLNLKDFDLYKKYRSCIKKIAVIHEDGQAPFVGEQFCDFKDTEIRVFEYWQIEEAQKWISK